MRFMRAALFSSLSYFGTLSILHWAVTSGRGGASTCIDRSRCDNAQGIEIAPIPDVAACISSIPILDKSIWILAREK